MSSELKDMLDGATAFFTAKPHRAAATSSVSCTLVGPTETAIENGKHFVTADEPSFAGGSNAGPSPASFVLMALASCEAVTFRYWSERLEIPFDSLEVDVEGDIDLRGALGFNGVRPGYTDVRVTCASLVPSRPNATTRSGPGSRRRAPSPTCSSIPS